MASSAIANVDYRLLDRLSNLVICSRCLRAGKVTPVPQVISKQHKPHNLCRACRAKSLHAESTARAGMRGQLLRLLPSRD